MTCQFLRRFQTVLVRYYYAICRFDRNSAERQQRKQRRQQDQHDFSNLVFQHFPFPFINAFMIVFVLKIRNQ